MGEGLKEGMKFSMVFKTGPQHSAKHVGSSTVDVLSTPSMIAFMEEACTIFCDKYLPEGQTTVGTAVNIKHVRAAPAGSEIRITGQLLNIEGRRLTFWVEAWWGNTRIGYGVHERHIIDKEKFIGKLKEAIEERK